MIGGLGGLTMTVVSTQFSILSKEEGDIIDITRKVKAVLDKIDLNNGIVTVFVCGSTGALTTLEYEPGLVKDFPRIMERIAPNNLYYEHEKRWHDDNGHSHIRASLVGSSLTVPFVNRKLTLGTWQQIVFLEFDTRSRARKIMVQIMGE